MLGAIIGDIVGSTYEVENHRSIYFEFFRDDARFTDDTVATFAVAKILLENDVLNTKDEDLSHLLRVFCLPLLSRGFGNMFYKWLCGGINMPYNSYGNGCLMRISPVFLYGKKMGWEIDKIIKVAEKITALTHSHPRSLLAVKKYMLILDLAYSFKFEKHKDEFKVNLRNFITQNNMDVNTIENYRITEDFDVTAEKSLNIACAALLESNSFEDGLALTVSVGGDTDTYCAIVAPVLEVLWLSNENLESYKNKIKKYFNNTNMYILDTVEKIY